MLPAQTTNQSSAQSPYYGSVTIVKPTDGVNSLTLDEAITLGLEHNLALVEAREQEQMEATPLGTQESFVRDQESGERDQGSGIWDPEQGDSMPRRFCDP